MRVKPEFVIKYLFIVLVLFQSSLQAQNNKRLNVVLMAGPNDHCPHEMPCHKYIQDMQVLRDGLLQQDDVGVRLLINERPVVGALDDVDVVVLHAASDESDYEWNALFPRLNQSKKYRNSDYMDFLSYFDAQMDRGMGLVVLHYSTAASHKQSILRMKKWVGGYFHEINSRVDGDLSAPGSTAVSRVSFPSPDHPILRGIKPWKAEDEYYYDMELMPGITPLLTSNLPVDKPETETIAWSLEREDGGRGFGFTGCHNHNNMYLEDYRKFVLNAVLWTGGVDIPENGADSQISGRYLE